MESQSTQLGAHIPMIYHFVMLQDAARMEGFREAINYAVKPGSVVLELGGGTGVLSFFAAQHARKVYCVEKIPENAGYARDFLSKNKNGDRVEVVCADAFEYLPPEPVDVVICEMIHVGMLREQQLAVIDSFKRRYRERYGDKLPKFIPEAYIQGIQPITCNFNFYGYEAPVPMFQVPGQNQQLERELGEPRVFQSILYDHQYPLTISWSGVLDIQSDGALNALRFILKNVLAIVPEESRGIYWHNQYLVLPLAKPLNVRRGDRVEVQFSYPSGGELAEAISSIKISNLSAPVSFPLRAQIEKISCNAEDEPTKAWSKFTANSIQFDRTNKQ